MKEYETRWLLKPMTAQVLIDGVKNNMNPNLAFACRQVIRNESDYKDYVETCLSRKQPVTFEGFRVLDPHRIVAQALRLVTMVCVSDWIEMVHRFYGEEDADRCIEFLYQDGQFGVARSSDVAHMRLDDLPISGEQILKQVARMPTRVRQGGKAAA